MTRVDETGGEARAYVLDDRVVLKVQRPHRLRPRTSLEKEAFFLQQLATYPDIVVPQVLGYGRQDTIEYLVMTHMPGVPALSVELTGVHRHNVLHQLGRTLRRLHALPQAPFSDSPLFPGTRTREAFVERVRANLAQAVQVIGDTPDLWQLDVAPADLASRVLAALPASSRPGGAAREPRAGPYLCPARDPRFCRPDRFRRCLHQSSRPRLALADPRGPCRPAARLLCRQHRQPTRFWPPGTPVLVLSDMATLATRPQTRPQALERLRDLLMTWA